MKVTSYITNKLPYKTTKISSNLKWLPKTSTWSNLQLEIILTIRVRRYVHTSFSSNPRTYLMLNLFMVYYRKKNSLPDYGTLFEERPNFGNNYRPSLRRIPVLLYRYSSKRLQHLAWLHLAVYSIAISLASSRFSRQPWRELFELKQRSAKRERAFVLSSRLDVFR